MIKFHKGRLKDLIRDFFSDEYFIYGYCLGYGFCGTKGQGASYESIPENGLEVLND